MAERRTNRDYPHITAAPRLARALLIALVLVGAIPGYYVIGLALLCAIRGN